MRININSISSLGHILIWISWINTSSNYEIFWDFLRFSEIFWDFLRFSEIFWDFLRWSWDDRGIILGDSTAARAARYGSSLGEGSTQRDRGWWSSWRCFPMPKLPTKISITMIQWWLFVWAVISLMMAINIMILGRLLISLMMAKLCMLKTTVTKSIPHRMRPLKISNSIQKKSISWWEASTSMPSIHLYAAWKIPEAILHFYPILLVAIIIHFERWDFCRRIYTIQPFWNTPLTSWKPVQ